MAAASLPIGYFAVGHVDMITLLVASFLLGLGVFIAVRTLPLRMLDQMLGALASTNSQFDAALNNMAQGLLLFDANKRIVVVNRKYIEMYGLSADVVKPGVQFADLIRHRKATRQLLRRRRRNIAPTSMPRSRKATPRALSWKYPVAARSTS